ncbi:MAG: hypothetical protein U5N10_09770 [Gemmobacter sp.]|nr:hypothetical protein [Gemmobacter sp.]
MPFPNPPGSETMTDSSAELIRDFCAIVLALSDARRLSLHLFGPGRGPLAARLVALQLDCRPETDEAQVIPADPGPFALAAQDNLPSDLLSVGLPLMDGGELRGLIRLQAARPDTLSRRIADPLTRMGSVIAQALRDEGRAGGSVLGQMIALLDGVSEHDDAAASRVLTGLLHLANGGVPSMVEITALRIAGLAEMAGTRVTLSAEGFSVLARAGIRAVHPAGAVVPAAQAEAKRIAQPRPRPEWSAFARVAIAEVEFDIGEATEFDPIAFRPAGSSGAWVELQHSLVDGWAEIAAEILARTHDVTLEFVRMHMIRRRDIALDEVAEVYELNNLRWLLRQAESGFETCIADAGWQTLELPPSLARGAADTRDIAAGAAIQLWPDLAERIGHDVRSWARRMAAGAKITPVSLPSVAA